MDTKRITPPTAAEAQVFLASIGGLCEWKPLCSPYHGDFEEAREYGPLITDELEAWWNSDEECCPYYDGSKEANTWYAAKAWDGRFEARCDREGEQR